MQVPKGLAHTPQDVQVTTGWLRKTGDHVYREPVYAIRDFLHNARMTDAKLNASNVWVDLRETEPEQGSSATGVQSVFSVEDNGVGMSVDELRHAMNLSPKASSDTSACQISYFGEGMKVAAQGLTQTDGFIMFFSVKDGNRTVVALDTGSKGQAQYYLLWLPPDMSSADYGPTDGLLANLVLCQQYTSADLPHPQDSIIDRICRSPAGARAISGNPKSPYDNVLELMKVFDGMQSRSHTGSGFRLEIHRPSAPGVDQPHLIGSMALSPPDAAGFQDIQLTDREGCTQSLTYLLAQVFLPAAGQQICGPGFWSAKTGSADPRPLSIHVNGQLVAEELHLWAHAETEGGQPSDVIEISLPDGTLLGSMQVIGLPRQSLRALQDQHKASGGIIWVMPNSDAAYNINPELPDFEGIWKKFSSEILRPDMWRIPTVWPWLMELAGCSRKAKSISGVLTKKEFDEAAAPAPRGTSAASAAQRVGRQFIRAIGLHEHIVLVQVADMKHIKMDSSKTQVYPDQILRPAIIRALIKHFKEEWEQEKEALPAPDEFQQPGAQQPPKKAQQPAHQAGGLKILQSGPATPDQQSHDAKAGGSAASKAGAGKVAVSKKVPAGSFKASGPGAQPVSRARNPRAAHTKDVERLIDQEADQPQPKRSRVEPESLSMEQWREAAQDDMAAVSQIMDSAILSSHKKRAEALAKELIAIGRGLLQQAKHVA